MAQKMVDDTPGLDPAEAMDAYVAAKNCTVNIYGYSPIQLAFGYAPTIPYFSVKGDTATDEEMSLVYKGYLKDCLQRMQDARLLAIGVMAKQRLKRALQHPGPANNDTMQVGDKVDWYNENSMKKGWGYWRGPGRLALLNPAVAFVQAGGRMLQRHVTHVRHTMQDTGLDVDGREVPVSNDDCDASGDQVVVPVGDGHAVDVPVERTVEDGERKTNAEVRNLTGQ